MEPNRCAAGWEQTLLVTFRAPALDLGEIMEDVTATVPDARFQCGTAGSDIVDVRMQLPDDAAMLNSAMQVIFHAQGSLRPAIRVRRVASVPLISAVSAGIPLAVAAAA